MESIKGAETEYQQRGIRGLLGRIATAFRELDESIASGIDDGSLVVVTDSTTGQIPHVRIVRVYRDDA